MVTLFFLGSSKSYTSSTLILSILLFSFNPLIVNSISFQFERFDPNDDAILYHGDAFNSDGAIEFNKVNYLSRVGLITYTDQVHIWHKQSGKVSDFSSHFSFFIDTLNQSSGHYGQGLTFFMCPTNFEIPPNFNGGFLGLLNTTTSFSSNNQMIFVEFDSFSNDEWDPPYEHVGINNNSIESTMYTRWNASEHSGQIANVWVTYIAATKNFTVLWSYGNNTNNNSENSSLSLQIDLMEVLPEWVIIGFSASTSEYVERHNLQSWEFTSNLKVKIESTHFQLLVGLFSPFLFSVVGGIVVFYILRW